jgi:hypothetical protein
MLLALSATASRASAYLDLASPSLSPTFVRADVNPSAVESATVLMRSPASPTTPFRSFTRTSFLLSMVPWLAFSSAIIMSPGASEYSGKQMRAALTPHRHPWRGNHLPRSAVDDADHQIAHQCSSIHILFHDTHAVCAPPYINLCPCGHGCSTPITNSSYFATPRCALPAAGAS